MNARGEFVVKRLLTLGGVLVFAAALGCGDGGPGPAPETPADETPADVLEKVAASFDERAGKALASALAENFVFHFDPRDVGQSPPGKSYVIPESWSHTEFRHAAQNMFGKAYSIDLTIPTNRVGTPGPNETTYKAGDITLSLLVMVTGMNGYIAQEGYCDFSFERYETASGNKYWRLSGWWDHTSEDYDGYPGVAPTSLGRILALYR